MTSTSLENPQRGNFDSDSKNFKTLVLVIGGCLLVSALVAGFYTHRQHRRADASAALFEANTLLVSELEALATSGKILPAPAPAKAKDPKGPSVEALQFQKFDVDAHLAGPVQKLQAVVKSYSGTLAAQEAGVTLGDLYFRHGQYDRAAESFRTAAEQASQDLDRALIYSSLGYALENGNKAQEAVQAFEKALQIAKSFSSLQSEVKGDLLLGMARSYLLLNDVEKARSTYDQILSQLPNTEYSRTAEALKGRL